MYQSPPTNNSTETPVSSFVRLLFLQFRTRIQPSWKLDIYLAPYHPFPHILQVQAEKQRRNDLLLLYSSCCCHPSHHPIAYTKSGLLPQISPRHTTLRIGSSNRQHKYHQPDPANPSKGKQFDPQMFNVQPSPSVLSSSPFQHNFVYPSMQIYLHPTTFSPQSLLIPAPQMRS